MSTDLKGPGHEQERMDSLISGGGRSGRDLWQWHFQKCAEYGFAGWWIYSYQDQEVFSQRTGMRSVDGQWKTGRLEEIASRHGVHHFPLVVGGLFRLACVFPT